MRRDKNGEGGYSSGIIQFIRNLLRKDLMEPLRAYIKENKILLPESYLADKKGLTGAGSNANRHAKGSWFYVWKGVYEIMELFPEYLPNTYLNYYLQQKEFVEHSDPNHTRANEVMETREKNLFFPPIV